MNARVCGGGGNVIAYVQITKREEDAWGSLTLDPWVHHGKPPPPPLNHMHTDKADVHEVPIENGHAVLSDRLRVPIEPMIGCIGLAPAEGRSSSMAPTFPWGGNMDLRELSPGMCGRVRFISSSLSCTDVLPFG